MFILLSTADVWCVKSGFSLHRFFLELGKILRPDDIIAVGSYSPGFRFSEVVKKISIDQDLDPVPYDESFKFNLEDYPEGRSWVIPASAGNLALLSGIGPESCKDGNIMPFDHLLAYRPGIPLLPLFNFHDACCGGDLYLSGLYDSGTVMEFAKNLESDAVNVVNPENV